MSSEDGGRRPRRAMLTQYYGTQNAEGNNTEAIASATK